MNSRLNISDCTYTDWESWSDCSKDCDVGQRERTRSLLSSPVETICSDETKQTEDCNIQPCATTTPSCTPWQQWSDCSASGCDVGSRSRSRDCFGNGQSTYDAEACYSDDPSCLSTTPICTDGKVWMDCSNPNISICPIDCKGYRMNSECTEPDACQPACYCPVGQVENEEGVCIDMEDCPCYSENGEIVVEGATWIPDGNKCEVWVALYFTANNCGLLCFSKCEYGQTVCDPVNDCCDWSDWGHWGVCSTTCGEGTQNRYRTLKTGNSTSCGSNQETAACNNPESLECIDCVKDGITYQRGELIPSMSTQCQDCACMGNNEIHCMNSTSKKIDGNWAAWGEWSTCTTNCTGGIRHRTRSCTDPLPLCNGLSCPGDNEETESCNQGISCCTVKQWESWTTCSQTCDGGKQFRIRGYEDPNDQLICDVDVKEERDCNTDPCITICNVTTWSDWTPCTQTCGQGTKTRDRSITGEVVADCPDNLFETDTCFAGECVCADNEKWSNGSECRRTCANRYDNLGYCNEIGCVCENGYYYDDNGNCVNESICDICTVNGVNYTSGETFPNPINQCEICECIDGQESCSRYCSIPTCAEDEELSYNPEDTPDSCCPVCKPKPKDTCTLRTKTEVLTASNGCVSNGSVTFTYCEGGCGNSTYEPMLRLNGDLMPNSKSDCKCCTGDKQGEKEIVLLCPGEGTQRAKIDIITKCGCNLCADSGTKANKHKPPPHEKKRTPDMGVRPGAQEE
ncbi:hypothetical protein FSP39_014075 [Pinctada imbricata]|uniref:SCO-spondin n=1 Tax=Pinctada imbricata TaxID=66713 RepID=A0AA89CBV1_PINIB|nr:hypothetical protein FSP39_014075 [Pinctada imbricata]